jgi:hypothetical protein
MKSFKSFYYNWLLISDDVEIPFYSIKVMSKTLCVSEKHLYNHYYKKQIHHPILKHFDLFKIKHSTLLVQ